MQLAKPDNHRSGKVQKSTPYAACKKTQILGNWARCLAFAATKAAAEAFR
jgi:hypothetical protein